jgi:hypothetical protein
LQDDGSFLIRGDADLEDCDAILALDLDEEEALKEFSTLSGFLCMCAGEIPNIGDFVMSRGWCFEIMHADDKRILQVSVERLVGAFNDEESEDEDNSNDNPLRSFLKRNLGGDEEENSDVASDSKVEYELERTRELNIETAREVERMVESGQQKVVLMNDALVDSEAADS